MKTYLNNDKKQTILCSFTIVIQILTLWCALGLTKYLYLHSNPAVNQVWSAHLFNSIIKSNLSFWMYKKRATKR